MVWCLDLFSLMLVVLLDMNSYSISLTSFSFCLSYRTFFGPFSDVIDISRIPDLQIQGGFKYITLEFLFNYYGPPPRKPSTNQSFPESFDRSGRVVHSCFILQRSNIGSSFGGGLGMVQPWD